MSRSAPSTFALALKYFRTRGGLTQEALAERAGISVRSVSDLERGISRAPRQDTVQLLAVAMALSADETAQLVALATPKAGARDNTLALSSADLPLVGRANELRELQHQLTDAATRLLTLIGVAGIGKTRLALEGAALLSETYPDGATVVDLSTIATSRFVLPTIAQTLGLREQPARAPIDAIADVIGDRRVLLILDNCEHVLDARADIAALLERCPQLTVLATSRERLALAGEHVLRVPSLAMPEALPLAADATLAEYPAVALFVACARTVQPDYAPPPTHLRTIAKICAILDGIPLAIELAAARVPVVPPRAILAQLSGGMRVSVLGWLRPARPRSSSRQQTLRDALEWSYRLLDAREQIAFRRLSVFAAGWTSEAAQVICDPHETMPIETVLASLIEKSLVVPDGAERFRMHYFVRAFGAEVLEARKEHLSVQRAAAEWYATLTERLEQDLTGANQAESLQQLIAEYDNIRASLQWTREHDAVVTGLRIAGSLWWFWENRGLLTEGRAWLEGMLALWQLQLAGIDDEIAARVYYGATILAITQGDTASGEVLGAMALQRMRDPARRARVLLLLGNLAKRRGDSDEALDYYTRGVAALRALGDVKGLLVALNNLSTLSIEHGDIEQGLTILEESLELKRSIGDQRGIAVSLINWGEALKTQGNYARAQAVTQEALDIFTELGDIQGITVAYGNLGEIAEAADDGAATIAAYEQNLAYARRMEDRAGIAQAALHLGQALTEQDAAQASTYLRESASLYGELDDAPGIITCALALARLALTTNAPQVAQQEMQRISPYLPQASASLQADVAQMAQQIGERLPFAADSD